MKRFETVRRCLEIRKHSITLPFWFIVAMFLSVSNERVSAQVGGPAEPPDQFQDACCVVSPDCNGTEISCSANPDDDCDLNDGYRVYAVDNRKACVSDTALYPLKACSSSKDKNECAVLEWCVYDPNLGRCAVYTEFPYEVPESCNDTCGNGAPPR